MSSHPRYAIYFSPDFDQPLWRQASAWLGRDANSGRELEQPELALGDLRELTKSPRFYGFHATLKAPFELAGHLTEFDLLSHAEVFAAQQREFEIELLPAEIAGFLALRLAQTCDGMAKLHRESVVEFDRFRAPLTRFDIERRNVAAMTSRQKQYFMDWGYPYVFEEFRFHMTLTGTIKDRNLRLALLAEAEQRFPPCRINVDGIAVYRQANRETPFTVLQRFRFA